MKGSGKLKLPERVKEIKRLFATTDLNDEEIAEMFGVSRPHINAIRNGKHYKDIEYNMIDYKTTYTIVGDYTYSSSVSSLKTNVGVKYVVVHYIDDMVYHETSRLYDEKPEYDTFRERHDLFVKRFVG